MLKKAALIFGVVFTLIGVLGFVPGVTTTNEDGMHLLLGVFMVDGMHNLVHLLSGVAGLVASSSAKYAKWYLLGFGVVYALVAILGFFTNPVLGFLHVNDADNLLHVVLAAGLLGAGLLAKDDETLARPAM